MDIHINTAFNLDDELEVRRSDLIGYYHPREIVADASLTVSRRRALLAHWLSDANAVRGAPGLRRSSAGVTVSVDELRAALCRLDEMTDAIPELANSQSLGA